jgi:outer membrane protein OmpA-like peptidoglycan-associated protein
VKLTDQTIEFSERVQYVGRGGRSELKESSANSLGLIALVLKGHPEIAQLRIEVQNDGVSRDETQRRAELIRDAIVRRGIDASRLTPVGLGGGGARLSFIIAEKKLPKPASPTVAPSGKPADAP